MGPELVADDVVVPARVAGGAVDDLEQDPGPLDVAQERVTQARTRRRALDQPGHVGDRRPPAVVDAQVHDAQVGLERGERVGRDLRLGGGEGREQRRLAGVGQAHEADVGDQPQLEVDRALLARLAALGVRGRLVGRGLEVRVAEAAATAARDHDLLADGDEVRDQGARRVVEHARAGRDGEEQVLAGLAVPP